MIHPSLAFTSRLVFFAICAVAISAPVVSVHAAGNTRAKPGRYYLPGAQASKIVSVSKGGNAEAEVILMTEAVAVKESGPQKTIKRFGEVYAYAPSFIAVHLGVPTMITLWNLQPDDDHDFALLGPDSQILMYVDVPPLKKTSYVFTFHRQGVFDFKCLQHQPEMSGQIMVLP
jgi:plastocyanin